MGSQEQAGGYYYYYFFFYFGASTIYEFAEEAPCSGESAARPDRCGRPQPRALANFALSELPAVGL